VTRPILMAVGVCLSAGAIGCSEFVDAFDFGEVEVVAETRAGEGVPGADLILFTGTRQLEVARTGEDGRHRFRFVPFGALGLFVLNPPGHTHLDPRYPDEPRTFRMREGDRRTFEFVFLRHGPGGVALRVEDPEGEPIEGVGLRLSRVGPPDLDPMELEAATDGSGEHVFEEVPFGHYELAVLPGPGYVVPDPATVGGLLVDEGWVEEVELTLERSPDGS